MKKTLTIISIVVIGLVTLALASFDHQDNNIPTYVIVAGMEGRDKILIYYGSSTDIVSVPVAKGEEVRLKIVDVLNDLSQKGFEVVSSTKHVVGQTATLPVFDYTLKKTR